MSAAANTAMDATCIQCGRYAVCVRGERGWICARCYNQPGRRVKFQSGNRFLRELITLYGDLPLEQLMERWKQDNPTKEN